MARFGFCGATYQSQSLNSDAQRCVNFFPETDESGLGKTPTSLYGTPGFTLFASLIGPSVRGMISIASSPTTFARMFAISGPWFYELFTSGAPIIRNSTNPFPGADLASMAASPTQILIISGGSPFCYNLATNSFQPLQTYSVGLGAIAAPFSIVAGGINYQVNDVVTPSVGGGSGGQFTITAVAGAGGGQLLLPGTTVANPGAGYAISDIVSPAQGGASGGALQVSSVNVLPLGSMDLTASPIAAPGNDYHVGDIATVIQAGASGGQVRVTALGPPTGGLIFAAFPSIGHPGSGYHLNDLITLTGGGGTGAVLQVATLTGSGVASLNVITAGSGYGSGSNIGTASTGGGTGLEVDIDSTPYISGHVTGIALYAGGSGYTAASGLLTTSGGGGSNLAVNITANMIPVGGVTGLTLLTAGVNYTSVLGVATTGGVGTGLTLNVAATPIASGAVTALSLTAPGTGYAPFSGNPGAVMTNVSGSLAGSGLQLNYSTSSVSPGSGMIANPIQCGFCAGFFVVLQANSQVIQSSQPEDASLWDPTQVAQVSVFSDNVVGMLVDHLQVWLWGSKQTQPYYLSGNIFPFDPYEPGYIEQGMASRNSAVRLDNSVFWIGADERGGGIAWRANGYTPQRVSNHAVEWAWLQYATISDAIGYAWQWSGHAFWQIYFPTAKKTWVYDCSTQQWHERTSFNPNNKQFEAQHSQCHIFANGMHLVGDWFTGNVYEVSGAAYDEDGAPIQRIRDSAYIFREARWIHHEQLQLDAEVGLGPTPPLLDGNGDYRDPQLSLQWSDNQGKSWSNEHILDCGAAGEFTYRVIARRLGRSRGRIYRVPCTDPIPWRFADAYLEATPDFQAGERLISQYAKLG